MRPNRACYNNEKISKVIVLSGDYKRHCDNIAHIKPAVDFTDHKHMKHTLKLATEKDRYTHNVRKLKLTELQKQNQQIIKRIQGINSHVRKTLQPHPPTTEPHPHRSLQRQTSRQSISSAVSDKTCGSNFRRRTIRMHEIEEENKKIAKRIMHPKMAKDINFSKFNRFFQQEQSYSRIRSRFSERSQTIMQSLALDGLKLQRKNVQFLPQISFKRLDRSLKRSLKGRSVKQSVTKLLNGSINPQ